jgi:hypothetical protein
MKDRLESSIKNLLEQVKVADQVLRDFKKKITEIDQQAARAKISKIKTTGLSEASKIRRQLEGHLNNLSKELTRSSGKLVSETKKFRSEVDRSLKVVGKQIRSITENERAKRRESKTKSA